MLKRRTFLTSLLAATAAPRVTWADAGNPAYLAAAKKPDGSYGLYGLDARGQVRFGMPLPTRGHAAAAHPTRPLAVAFARRPGTYAIVLDCISGDVINRLEAPEGRHFYGHGAFSLDGTMLFTTENDLETGAGVIGVWDDFQRVGEFPSNGIGPHEILRLPMSDTLVVANGGILTHPDTGRAKLNLDSMRPNLSYLTPEGQVVAQIEFPEHQNSIRHLTVRPDGLVGMAMQWQGHLAQAPALLALHSLGEPPVALIAPPEKHRWLKGYAGSIAFSANGESVAITSPHGGVAQVFNAESGGFSAQIKRPDICGLAAGLDGFIATDGLGGVAQIMAGQDTPLSESADISWDNHLIKIG